MTTTAEYLEILRAGRGTAVVVTTMTAARLWPQGGDSPLDINYLPSAMGHAADLALGIALAQPQRSVVCVNGDGSLAMNLGGLITAVAQRAANFVHLLIVNHSYHIVGGPPIPAAGRVDWAGLARAAGWLQAWTCASSAEFAAILPAALAQSGPHFIALEVTDPPAPLGQLPPRHPAQALRDLRSSWPTLPPPPRA